MFLLDSNIIIYALSPSHDQIRDFLRAKNLVTSIISKIEVLGYSKLTDHEREGFQIFFGSIPSIQLTESIVESAIKLRQVRKMTLGDSIIAATALVNKLELVTANTKDFDWISDLKVVNFQ